MQVISTLKGAPDDGSVSWPAFNISDAVEDIHNAFTDSYEAASREQFSTFVLRLMESVKQPIDAVSWVGSAAL